MRQIHSEQIAIDEIDISNISIDYKSRDGIDKAAIGLQYIYTTPEIKAEVFEILKEVLPTNISRKTGRPGMDMWKILVLAVFRQLCNWDYDSLQSMANNHRLIRELLGHNCKNWADNHYYELQTLKDNVSLLKPEVIDRINEAVVRAGHKILSKKKAEAGLNGSIDSFPVQMDIHYPTDINLLYDAIRTSLRLIKGLCNELELSGWRQAEHHVKSMKRQYRKAQKTKRARGAGREQKLQAEHEKYIEKAQALIDKVEKSIEEIVSTKPITRALKQRIEEIEKFQAYGRHQIDLIRRRVLQGETIPHSEKIHSVFQPEVRWMSKGKAGVPVEFGLPVAIIKDQHGYILDHEVMEKTSDVDVAVPLTKRAKEKFPALKSCSYDKGFWSPDNREQIGEIIELPVMPKKGRKNKEQVIEQNSEEFVEQRRKHSAVESMINSLGHSGLKKCRDQGAKGLKKIVSISILARNLHTLGNTIRKKEDKRMKRTKKIKARDLFKIAV